MAHFPSRRGGCVDVGEDAQVKWPRVAWIPPVMPIWRREWHDRGFCGMIAGVGWSGIMGLWVMEP